MKIGMVNKLTIMNRFVLHTLQRNVTHLAVITRKTNIKIDILKGRGESGKEPIFLACKINIACKLFSKQFCFVI